jgi:hypothetical protein
MCAKNVKTLDKKVWGGVKGKKGEESACESKQSWISSVIYIDLRTSPTPSPSS